jgi:hypothetical protein
LKNELGHTEQVRRPASHRSGSDVPDASVITQRNDDAKSTSRRSAHSSQHTLMTRVLPERLIERTREKQTQRVQYRKRHDLKLACSEFYLMLVLLQNYQTLNFTGFRKILKKHDKLLQTTRGEEWR